MTVNKKYASILTGVAIVASLAALVVWLATHTEGRQNSEAYTDACLHRFPILARCVAAQPKTSKSVDIERECALPVRIIGDPIPVPPSINIDDVESIPVHIVGSRDVVRVVPVPPGEKN